MAYTLPQEDARGAKAREILDEPLVAEAFSKIEAEILTAWEDSPARDIEGREKLYQMLMLTRKVKRHFESVVLTGEMARRTLAEYARKERL
jgi:hypothetical protein